MDLGRSLESGRDHYGGGGGGGRGGYRGGGGGRNSNRPYRGGGGRGRGGGYRGGGGNHNNNNNRNQPYRSRGGGRGGGGGGRGNRFGQTQQLDPDTLLLRQIASFVSRVGEFQNLRDAPETTESITESTTTALRKVEYTAASNINDLLPILCAPDKLERLLKYSPQASKMEEKVGKLVHLVVSCVADLPLQTPCYAALTLAVHEQVKGNASFEGFATRCLQYAMLQIAKELDTTLLTSNPTAARSTCRLKLLLRYLCILANMGLVTAYEGEATVDPNRMTVFGFVSVLVDSATAAAEQFNNATVSSWLALIVLSTVPYLMELPTIPSDVIEEKICKPMERLLGTFYKSSFTPGTGMTALLLKEPQLEGDEQDEDDDEEDDDEEEGEGSGQICDSLQDLLRATKYWRKEGQASRFAVPVDAPWKGLILKAVPNPDSGEETESRPVTYTESPLYLAFPQECQLLNLLLSGAGSDSPLKLQYFSLEGTVFARLPIFGSPPDPEEEDDDEEEEMEAGATKNEQLEAFRALSLLDRYFVAETMRDCLLSHESHVNPSGLQFGSAKSAAEELLRVCHVFPAMGEDDPSKGMEYAILETIFALLAQSTERSSLRHIYLSRVLLELTRLEPSRISQALAIAMTNLFQDYLPALVPAARENFSCWFAFHLSNTDYQWPSAYWQLYEPYATSENETSRGTFVKRALHLMVENLGDPTPMVKQSFGSAVPSLTKELLGRSSVPFEETSVASLEVEINRQLWDNQVDPAVLLEYLQGEEVGAALGASTSKWARTDAFVRVLLDPARQLEEGLKTVLDKVVSGVEAGEDDMEDDSTLSKDVYATITDAIQKYKTTLLGVLAKDAEASGGEAARVQGGAFLLRRVESMASFNSGLLDGVVVSLLQNRVVGPMSVMKWVLRDVGDSLVAPLVPSWSKYSVIAVREGLVATTSDATAGGTMTIDGGGGAPGDELLTDLTSKLGQLLNYALQRVCSLLVTTQLNEKKLKPFQVNLVEGMKSLVFTSKILFTSTLTRPSGIHKPLLASEVEDLISKSDMSGTSLAAICASEQSSTAVVYLKQSLENL
jgi:hypothetical protein